MTLIILVRHGQTEWNRDERFRGHTDIELNETGLAQARALAARISAQWHPVAVYVGPLTRTRQTGDAIAHSVQLAAQVEDGLIDVDCGGWQGLTPAEVQQRWPAEYQTYLHSPEGFTFPGGDSLEAARMRGMDCLQKLIAPYPDQTLVLVSHNALNRLLLLTILGLGTQSYWSIRQDLCALNAFEAGGGHFSLITLNETGHLLSVSSNQDETGGSKTE